KGVPIRLEVGPRDMQAGQVFMGRRDKSPKDKQSISRDQFVGTVTAILDEMQEGLLANATKHRQENTRNIENWDDFVAYFTPANPDKPEIHGGFARAFWNFSEDHLPKLKELKV